MLHLLTDFTLASVSALFICHHPNLTGLLLSGLKMCCLHWTLVRMPASHSASTTHCSHMLCLSLAVSRLSLHYWCHKFGNGTSGTAVLSHIHFTWLRRFETSGTLWATVFCESWLGLTNEDAKRLVRITKLPVGNRCKWGACLAVKGGHLGEMMMMMMIAFCRNSLCNSNKWQWL